MVRKARLIGAVAGAALLATRMGRRQLGRVAALAKGPAGNVGDPLAVEPTPTKEEIAAGQPPTPGTLAVPVGAPNAPDLDVIVGDHSPAKP